jgi:hypothetical protein
MAQQPVAAQLIVEQRTRAAKAMAVETAAWQPVPRDSELLLAEAVLRA